MSVIAPVPVSGPQPIHHGGPPILVLGVFALVVAGALACSLLFFTAGLVLIPVLVAATLVYGFFTKRDRGEGGPEDAPPPT